MLWIALSIVTVSCSHIPIYDSEVCGDLGPAGAHCAHTLINKKRDIPKAQWDVERIGQLCETSRAFTDKETAIDTFCNNNPNLCDYQVRQDIAAVRARLDPVAKKAARARKKHFSEIQSVNPEGPE